MLIKAFIRILHFQIVLTFVFVTVTSAHVATSYVNRHDGGSDHGYHQHHHEEPLLVTQPVEYYTHAEPIEHSWDPSSSGYAYAPDYHQDYYAYPKYKFEYGVKDDHTGDHKSQWEVRDGDVVKGEYSLIEPDGTKRIVSYTADDQNGFNAVVKKVGHAYHPEVYHPQPIYHNQPIYHQEPYHHEHHEEPHYEGYANSYSNLYGHH